MHTASLLAGFGLSWVAIAILALVYLWWKQRKSAKEVKPKEEIPRYVNTVIKKKIKQNEMDRTKLNSLQPANRSRSPIGWESEEVEIDGVKSHQWTPQVPLKGEFSWKFYGSQLSIGEKTIWAGLPKKMHLLEITPQDQVYLDGSPKSIHPGELDQLKRTIRDAEL